MSIQPSVCTYLNKKNWSPKCRGAGPLGAPLDPPLASDTPICSRLIGLLGFNASATARVISRRWNDDDEISFLVEETGVPGGNHRPTASNWWNLSYIQPLPSPGIELGPQRCEASELGESGHQKTTDFIIIISPPWYDPGCCWGVRFNIIVCRLIANEDLISHFENKK